MTRLVLAALAAALLPTTAAAQYRQATEAGVEARPASSLPAAVAEVGFDQRLGVRVPLTLEVVDEDGRERPLGSLLHADRPVLLALVYYECPMLCNLVIEAVVRSLRAVPLTPGADFEVVAVSFDPAETAALAAAKKASTVASYGRPETAPGWHFLTASEATIRELTSAVGFRYAYMPERDEWAHASGIVLLTPDGHISRYFYGIEYAPRDVRLGLVEAADGAIGSVIDQLLLYCFHYDPVTGRYGALTMRLVRVGGALTVLILGGAIFWMVCRERRPPAATRAGA